MNIDEVMQLVRLAKAGVINGRGVPDTKVCAAINQHVAEAVAREREECAKACEDVATTRWDEYAASYNSAVFDCTAAIRARGTT